VSSVHKKKNQTRNKKKKTPKKTKTKPRKGFIEDQQTKARSSRNEHSIHELTSVLCNCFQMWCQRLKFQRKTTLMTFNLLTLSTEHHNIIFH